jgi:hypothetical protein
VAEVKVTVRDAPVTVATTTVEAKIVLGNSGPQGPRGTQVLSGATDPSINIGLLGDQYINTSSGKLFGPKTGDGWGEGVYIGVNDPENLGQVHIQNSPSSVWNITHTLEFIPNLTVVNSEGKVVIGDYQYIDENTIIATFSKSITGLAYLS